MRRRTEDRSEDVTGQLPTGCTGGSMGKVAGVPLQLVIFLIRGAWAPLRARKRGHSERPKLLVMECVTYT